MEPENGKLGNRPLEVRHPIVGPQVLRDEGSGCGRPHPMEQLDPSPPNTLVAEAFGQQSLHDLVALVDVV